MGATHACSMASVFWGGGGLDTHNNQALYFEVLREMLQCTCTTGCVKTCIVYNGIPMF